MGVIQSNRGIILAANGNASGGSIQLPSNSSVDAPRVVNAEIAQRGVLTVAMGFNAVTSFTIRIKAYNNSKFDAIAAGSAAPNELSGAEDADIAQPYPILSVAQRDVLGGNDNGGFQSIDHIYTAAWGVDADIILFGPGIIGPIYVGVTVAGIPSGASDFIKLALAMV